MAAHDYSYIFFIPPPAKNSAGITFFYDLAKDLRERGFDAWTTSDLKDTFFLEDPYERTIPFSKALGVIRFGKAIAVYPETVSGNPLGSRRVVRIVANKPGYLGGDEEYQVSERVFVFSHYYTQYVKSRICGYLYKPSVTISDLEIFKITNKGLRDKKLFYQGKGEKSDLYITSEYFEITRASPKRSELPTLFNQADHVIVFDNSTALIQEAALCGCVPIIIPDGSFSRADLEAFELSDTGVAWGVDDLARARETLPLLREKILAAIRDFQYLLEDFIRKTQEEWISRPNSVDSTDPFILESVSYERDLLWNHMKANPRLWTTLSFAECFRHHQSTTTPVLIWGAGQGAAKAIRMISFFQKIIGVTAEENRIPDLLNSLNIPFFSCDEIVNLNNEFETIVVASVFRDSILSSIKSLGFHESKRVVFLSLSFLSNSG